jgi:hypothetical protein
MASATSRATRTLLVAALGSRAVVLLCTFAGTFFTRADYRFWSGGGEGFRWAYLDSRWLDGFGRWDTWFYLRIAASGYGPAPEGGWAHEAAFFPLFPMLTRGVAELTGLPLFLAGLAVSWACFCLAVRAAWLFFRADEEPSLGSAGEERAAWAVAVLLLFPGSLFLTAVYTESLFLLLAALALLGARRGAFGVAGVAAALAALTRPNGILLLVPLAIEAWRARTGSARRLALSALPFLLAPLAVAAHALLIRQIYGDPFYFQKVQAAWGRHLSGPWEALLGFHFDPDYYAVALALLVAVVAAWRRGQRPAWQAWGLLSLALPLSTGTLKSLPRFAGVDLPFFWVVARWTESRRARWIYAAGALALLAVYAFRLGRGDAIN